MRILIILSYFCMKLLWGLSKYDRYLLHFCCVAGLFVYKLWHFGAVFVVLLGKTHYCVRLNGVILMKTGSLDQS